MASTIEAISKVFLLTLFEEIVIYSQNFELYIKDDIIVYFAEVYNKLKILVALAKTYVSGKRSALINFVFLNL